MTVRVGHELIDDYLHFLGGRSRPNSVLAAGYDLKVFLRLVCTGTGGSAVEG